METNTIKCGNCIDLLNEFPDSSIDLTIFSPPYDGIRDYEGEWDLDLNQLGKVLFNKTKDGGIGCMVIGDSSKDFAKTLTSFKTCIQWSDSGWKLFECCIYARKGTEGAWWSKRFRVDHEYIFIFLKGKRPRFFNKEPLKIACKYAGDKTHGSKRLTDGSMVPMKRRNINPTKCRGTIWPYNASCCENNPLKLTHPATYPDKLAEDLILCFSQENDLVIDPTCGSGTTLIMANKNKRNYWGCDISEKYVNITQERLLKECF